MGKLTKAAQSGYLVLHLCRFFNTQTGIHSYVAAEADKDSIMENLLTFNFEGYYLPGRPCEDLSLPLLLQDQS